MIRQFQFPYRITATAVVLSLSNFLVSVWRIFLENGSSMFFLNLSPTCHIDQEDQNMYFHHRENTISHNFHTSRRLSINGAITATQNANDNYISIRFRINSSNCEATSLCHAWLPLSELSIIHDVLSAWYSSY
jgi:hypothetical protein